MTTRAPASTSSETATDSLPGRRWGSNWRQRVRLYPLYTALRLADALGGRAPRPGALAAGPWQPGIAIVIPERDAADLLGEALAGVRAATVPLTEPVQVVVAANGAPRDRYAGLASRFPEVEWVHHDAPLGFSGAVAAGLRAVRQEWTLLLNNDMVLAPDALAILAAERAERTFALAAQIEPWDAQGRREETGFTDWYVDARGIRIYHAIPGPDPHPRPTLCASGGAALFRTAPLRRYVAQARDYDPFYWEDVEWSVRAWHAGLAVRFCPRARVRHRHRATTARLYPADELARIVERNRLLFDARNAASGADPARLMRWICDLPYASQRELARMEVAAGVFPRRREARAARDPTAPPRLEPGPPGFVAVAPASYSYAMRSALTGAPARPRAVVVSPFAVYPPRHGGARRIAGLLAPLRDVFDLVLVCDEASQHNPLSFAHFDGLYAVTLVERGANPAGATDLAQRMRLHTHPALQRALAEAIARHQPRIVQIEHAELAALVTAKTPGVRWVLALHDAVHPEDFERSEDARAFAALVDRYDAVTVCSSEDALLVDHPRTACVPNGTHLAPADYRPSASSQLLFVGPFRYQPNLDGIRAFLRTVWPEVRAAVPGASLRILGGDTGPAVAADDPLFAQPGVEVLGHRDDMQAMLAGCALTINPQTAIRGSAIKLIESLMAGRICVSTEDGARGFRDAGLDALVTVPDVAGMAVPIVALLQDATARRLREAPADAALARFRWPQCAALQRELWESLL